MLLTYLADLQDYFLLWTIIVLGLSLLYCRHDIVSSVYPDNMLGEHILCAQPIVSKLCTCLKQVKVPSICQPSRIIELHFSTGAFSHVTTWCRCCVKKIRTGDLNACAFNVCVCVCVHSKVFLWFPEQEICIHLNKYCLHESCCTNFYGLPHCLEEYGRYGVFLSQVKIKTNI